MSNCEYARLNATWLTLTDIQFQCSAIEENYKKRKDADVVIKYRRIENGCGKIHKEPKIEIGNIAYYSCLCNTDFRDDSIYEFIWLHQQFTKGLLAFKGALTEQPSKYIELMKILDQLQNEKESNGK